MKEKYVSAFHKSDSLLASSGVQRRHPKPGPLAYLPHAPLVRVCGDDLSARVEEHRNEDKIDHVWISVQCGLPSPVTVSVNTLSIRNRSGGFDPRIRLGRVSGLTPHLPRAGCDIMPGFDYAQVEQDMNIFYETLDRPDVEKTLIELTTSAALLEAWGAPYRRHGTAGLHQVHSRRASCAVQEDLLHRDGGLKFYTPDHGAFRWTMVLIKFCGQP